MPLRHPLTLSLAALLVLLQGSLWLGDGGKLEVRALQAELNAAHQANDEVRRGNDRMLAEVQDLRAGLEMVEERARADLGLIKRDEVFVQYGAGGSVGLSVPVVPR